MDNSRDSKTVRFEKITLVGPEKAGKSMLTPRLAGKEINHFPEEYQATIGVDFIIKKPSDT